MKISLNSRIFQNEFTSHLAVFIAYFLFLSVLRFKIDFDLVFFWIGGLFGTYLLDADHLIYWFFAHPEKEDSIKAKAELEEVKKIGGVRGMKQGINRLYQLLINSHQTHNRLTFHTITFQIILLAVTIYVLTSSGNPFGAGLVIALNLHLLKDVWQDYLQRGESVLADWFLWQVRDWGFERYLREYLVIVTFVFLIISRLFV